MDKTFHNRIGIARTPALLMGVATTLSLILSHTGSLKAEEQTSFQQTTPADVYDEVGRLKAELETLRLYMGKPKAEGSGLIVKQVTPRGVYFQALVLFENANQFCFDHTRERTLAPLSPSREIKSADVLQLVHATLDCLNAVKARYKIETPGQQVATIKDVTPTEVFHLVVQANRQLNLMLDRRVAPSDVFEQVTLAIGYATRMLETIDDRYVMPDEPKFEPGKQPADVYDELSECFLLLNKISEQTGRKILVLDTSKIDRRKLVPNDVLNLASLVVSELSYMHSELPNAAPPREVLYVGRKFPSDVSQRVGLLKSQLEQLVKQVESDPKSISKP